MLGKNSLNNKNVIENLSEKIGELELIIEDLFEEKSNTLKEIKNYKIVNVVVGGDINVTVINGQQNSCEICKEIFDSQIMLSTHMKIHEKIRQLDGGFMSKNNIEEVDDGGAMVVECGPAVVMSPQGVWVPLVSTQIGTLKYVVPMRRM